MEKVLNKQFHKVDLKQKMLNNIQSSLRAELNFIFMILKEQMILMKKLTTKLLSIRSSVSLRTHLQRIK